MDRLAAANYFRAQPGPATPGDGHCWQWVTLDLGDAGAGIPCLLPKGHAGRCGGIR